MMAMHPSGDFLYTAHRSLGDGVTVWRTNDTTGALRLLQPGSDGLQSLDAMTMAPDGRSLLAFSRISGSVVHWGVDPETGRLAAPVQVTAVPAPRSLAVRYL